MLIPRLKFVAPYTGAWIEIGYAAFQRKIRRNVAPYTGAWIEILCRLLSAGYCNVAPYTGAWIEINTEPRLISQHQSRSLHGSVD